MPLGQRIRELRDERDISLRELAKKLHCSAAFLSDVELGRRFPSEKMLKDIASLLKVSVVDLKAYDVRPPIEEIKRLTQDDPRYAMAFRTVIDHGVRPDQLIRLAKRVQEEDQGKKKK
jgi:transcriptional regulator with XRE-family HTH domain